jgi:hypothetical protein
VEFDKLLPLLPQGIPLVWEMSPSQRRAKVQEMRGVWRERYGL